jgi:hypothetical protein
MSITASPTIMTLEAFSPVIWGIFSIAMTPFMEFSASLINLSDYIYCLSAILFQSLRNIHEYLILFQQKK